MSRTPSTPRALGASPSAALAPFALAALLAAPGCKSTPHAGPAEVSPSPVATATAAASQAANTGAAAATAKTGAAAGLAAGAIGGVRTRREDLVEDHFGVKVADPYRWLEDEHSPEVQAWMKAQDARARAHLAQLPERDAFAEVLRPLYYVESRSAPMKRGGRLFFTRKAKDREKAVVYWQDGEKGTPEVLLDPNAMSAAGTVSLQRWTPSWDGKLVAYMVAANNADAATMRVMEVATGRVLEGDVLEGLRYTDASWSADGRGFYYTWQPSDPKIPPAERAAYAEVRYHRLGTDPKQDAIVHERTGDASKWLGAWASRDGKYLFLSVTRGWSEEEVWVRFLKEKDAKWVPLATGVPARYDVVTWKDRFYVATNEGAPRWKVYVVDPKKLDRKSWKELVPEHPSAVLRDLTIVGGHLGLSYLESASSRLELRTLAGKLVREEKLPELGTTSGWYGLEDDDTAYYSFSSFLRPGEVWATSVKRGKSSLFARVEAPVEPEKLEVEQVFYPSKDGTRVSMFVLHAKGLVKDGSHPTILYGYGGFDISLTPNFNPPIYAWLARGGVYAIPNLRGGGEYGEAWHQAGMLGKKQNVFDDFIAAGEWLVSAGYTKPERLGIAGGSNGGLLVGAAMTQRPELFGAVACAVPLLDMVRYARFGVGTAWVPEYGDPERAEDLAWLHAYSPYHRVVAGTRYPALLLLSADSDDRVDPMHARKFMAAIEAASTGDRPKLLRVEQSAGHRGADQRRRTIAERADELAFFLAELGGATK